MPKEEASQKQAADGSAPPELAQEAVMVKSVPVAEGTPEVKGYDFNKGRDLDGIMAAAMTTGFQVCARLGILVFVCILAPLAVFWHGLRPRQTHGTPQ